MAFSLLRFGVKSVTNIIEKSNCFSVLGTTKITGVTRRNDTFDERKKIKLHHYNPQILSVRHYGKSINPARQGYSSASESDSDDEYERRPRGESEFWRKKMRTFHSLLDVNKDGVVSFDDFLLLADKFVSLGHLTEKQTEEFRKCIKELWESQWGEITPYNLVRVEQYLEDMHHVLNDKQLKKKVHKFLPYLFKAVDKDNSGEISVEEFKLFFKCLGIDDVHAIVSFSLIDTNNDGKLSIREFVKHGRDFFVTENELKVSKLFWGPLVDH